MAGGGIRHEPVASVWGEVERVSSSIGSTKAYDFANAVIAEGDGHCGWPTGLGMVVVGLP
jgi:hypothetical protein